MKRNEIFDNLNSYGDVSGEQLANEIHDEVISCINNLECLEA